MVQKNMSPTKTELSWPWINNFPKNELNLQHAAGAPLSFTFHLHGPLVGFLLWAAEGRFSWHRVSLKHWENKKESSTGGPGEWCNFREWRSLRWRRCWRVNVILYLICLISIQYTICTLPLYVHTFSSLRLYWWWGCLILLGVSYLVSTKKAESVLKFWKPTHKLGRLGGKHRSFEGVGRDNFEHQLAQLVSKCFFLVSMGSSCKKNEFTCEFW